MTTKEYLLVAAIDFGTAFSGYAYSFRADFLKDPLNLLANPSWKNGTANFCSLKTPTVILFDPEEKFHSFGYEAETTYVELLQDDDEDYKQWFFFRNFKMALSDVLDSEKPYKKKISRRLKITGENGKEMKAVTIFSEAIRFMKNHLLTCINERIKGMVDRDDIHWVLTVPAIWNDQAKQFMREAAEMAGIPYDQLTLALEPEAAAIYCNAISIEIFLGSDGNQLAVFRPGQKFMILDCGGGTVDITVYKVRDDRRLEELHERSGGPWGGMYVDQEFTNFLKNLVGKAVWDSVENEYPMDCLEIKRVFEAKKRLFIQKDPNVGVQKSRIVFTVISNIENRYTEISKTSFQKHLSSSLFKDDVSVSKGRLFVSNHFMSSFFEKSVNAIISHLDYLFNLEHLEDVKLVLMVGGYSESDYLKSKVKERFKDKEFIIPQHSSLAVLKGAVIFGHNPGLIRLRKSPLTLGISVSIPFDRTEHPQSHFQLLDGRELCTDVFHIMVRKDQLLDAGITTFEDTFYSSHFGSTREEIEVYSSTEDNPKYTSSDSCKKLGVLKCDMTNLSATEKILMRVKIYFGYTELKVSVKEEGTNLTRDAKFDFL